MASHHDEDTMPEETQGYKLSQPKQSLAEYQQMGMSINTAQTLNPQRRHARWTARKPLQTSVSSMAASHTLSQQASALYHAIWPGSQHPTRQLNPQLEAPPTHDEAIFILAPRSDPMATLFSGARIEIVLGILPLTMVTVSWSLARTHLPYLQRPQAPSPFLARVPECRNLSSRFLMIPQHQLRNVKHFLGRCP